MKKFIPLLFLITISLGLGIVAAQTTYERGTAFLSDVGGGNITFAQNITATTFSNAVGNQARFTVIDMLANGTWAELGFRNNNGNNTVNITTLGEDWISFDAIIENNTIIEVYTPRGEPFIVTGGTGTAWVAPTVFITMNADDTVTLQWGQGALGSPINQALNNFVSLLPLIVILAFFGAKQLGLISNLAFVWVIITAVFVAVIFIATQTGWL